MSMKNSKHHKGCALFVGFIFLFGSQKTTLIAQSLSPATPAQEFIRLNGQIVAVDNPAVSAPVTGANGFSGNQVGGASGQTTYNSGTGTYTVQGSGAGLTGTTDQEQFTYSTLNGDGAFVVRLSGVQNATSTALTGIAIRESLDPSAQQAFIGAQNGQNVYGFARQQDGAPTSTQGYASAAAPEWFMLQRFGETIFLWNSSDGKNWNLLTGQLRVTMGASALVGFLVSSGSTAATTTATFDNVRSIQYPPFFSLSGNMAGDYFVLVNRNSGKALDQPGANGTDGLPLQQYGLNYSSAERWGVVANGGYFYGICSNGPNDVLSLTSASGAPPTAPGTPVVQSPQQYRDDQNWMMVSSDGVWVSFLNKYSGLALGVAGQSKADAAALEQVTYNPSDFSQQWQIVPNGPYGIYANSPNISVPSLVSVQNAPATATVYVNMYTGQQGFGAYGLGAYDPSYSDAAVAYLNGQPICGPFQYAGSCAISGFADGAQLTMKEANKGITISTATLHVFPGPYSGTTYKLRNESSSLFLRWNGSGVDQAADDGGTDVQWTFTDAGSGNFYVVNQAGKLGVASAGVQYGALFTVSASTDLSQVWQVAPKDATHFTLVNLNASSQQNTSMVVEITAATPGSPTNLWNDDGNSSRQWILIPVN